MEENDYMAEWNKAFSGLNERQRIYIADAVLRTIFTGKIPRVERDIFGSFARLCPKRLADLFPYFWIAYNRLLNNKSEILTEEEREDLELRTREIEYKAMSQRI